MWTEGYQAAFLLSHPACNLKNGLAFRTASATLSLTPVNSAEKNVKGKIHDGNNDRTDQLSP
jgi:hypothetical protein